MVEFKGFWRLKDIKENSFYELELISTFFVFLIFTFVFWRLF